MAPLIVAADLEHLIESKQSIRGRNTRDSFFCCLIKNFYRTYVSMNEDDFTNAIIGWQFLLGITLILFIVAIFHTIANCV